MIIVKIIHKKTDKRDDFCRKNKHGDSLYWGKN